MRHAENVRIKYYSLTPLLSSATSIKKKAIITYNFPQQMGLKAYRHSGLVRWSLGDICRKKCAFSKTG
jgi:hypothetical protein